MKKALVSLLLLVLSSTSLQLGVAQDSALEAEEIANYTELSSISALVWSPDDNFLAVIGRQDQATAHVLSAENWMMDFEIRFAVNDLEWSPDGTQIASLGIPNAATNSGAKVYISDGSVGSDREQLGTHMLRGNPPSDIHSVAWSPDGLNIMTATNYNSIIWDVESGEPLAALTPVPGETTRYIADAQWSPSGEKIAIIVHNSIWVGATPELEGSMSFVEPIEVIEGDLRWGYRIAWSPDESLIAAEYNSPEGHEIVVWDVENSEVVETISGFSPSWSPEGDMLAVGGDSIQILDAETFETIVEIDKQAEFVEWSYGGDLLATVSLADDSENESATIWRIAEAD